MKTTRYANVRYYHCMPFDFVSFAEIDADPERTEDEGCRLAFRFLEQQIGFYPIFLACGEQNASVITGYSDQWRVVTGTKREAGRFVNTQRKRGEFPNFVMMVFELDAISEPVFTSYHWWCRCLNACMNDFHPSQSEIRGLFRRSLSRSDWLRLASRQTCDVQVIAPRLDLRKACEIWVRNHSTAKAMEALGFENLVVKRLPIAEKSF